MRLKNIEKYIRLVPNFPKEGIMFRDITPLFTKYKLINSVSKKLSKLVSDVDFDVVVGMESRGFLFGTLLAMKHKTSFVLARKSGKLPYEKVQTEYKLEYGNAIVEMHTDSITSGQLCVIHDDLLATGGSALACAELVERLGGIVVGFNFVIELTDLGGMDNIRKKYPDVSITSLFKY